MVVTGVGLFSAVALLDRERGKGSRSVYGASEWLQGLRTFYVWEPARMRAGGTETHNAGRQTGAGMKVSFVRGTNQLSATMIHQKCETKDDSLEAEEGADPAIFIVGAKNAP